MRPREAEGVRREDMAEGVENIKLFAEAHAIEVANFVVNLGLPIDFADMRLFDEKVKGDGLYELFPAINIGNLQVFGLNSDEFQIDFGKPAPNWLSRLQPSLIEELTFELTSFSNDGKLEWAGSFGENRVLVSCRKYTKWEEVWSSAKARLYALLDCIDPYKPVRSVDYSVTDTFSAKKDDEILNSPKLFKKNNFIAKHILNICDPRWDFSQGWFENDTDNNQLLIRVDGQSAIHNNLVIASISNLHSQRFGKGIGVGELTKTEDGEKSKADWIFEDLHDKNKDLIRDLLTKDLLERMGLGKKNA